ncbi:Mut7-C RNAse domain-containing protein [Chloroflexota bacterium]
MLINNPKFIVDHNVGKLAKWLRIMGYDTLFFNDEDDSNMIDIALTENRIILTRDTQIAKRRVVIRRRLEAVLVTNDKPERQLHQIIEKLKLDQQLKPFTICLECNEPLVERDKKLLKNQVPPYVFKTQNQYMECPACHRIYYRGTRWQAMIRNLNKLMLG